MKIELPKQAESFLKIYGKEINNTYLFLPKIYKKLGDNQYEELNFSEIPLGLQKYVKDTMGIKE